MASRSLYPQFETNLMSNRKAIELLLQLKRAKVHGKHFIKVKPHLVRNFLRNRLLEKQLNPKFLQLVSEIDDYAKDGSPGVVDFYVWEL